jgi:hypothetical protein
VSFADASFANVDGSRSTSGGIHFLANGPVSWDSRVQKKTAASTTEAEIAAVQSASLEVALLRKLLKHLGFEQKTTVMYEDNRSAIYIAKCPIPTKKSKYFRVAWNIAKELMDSGKIVLQYAPTDLQVADMFTKALAPVVFTKLRNFALGGAPMAQLLIELGKRSKTDDP